MFVVAAVSALVTMSIAIHGREVTVPDLTGRTLAEARRAAEQNGVQLLMERQFYSPSVAEGRIVSQSPAAGTRVRRGWQIRAAESLGKQRIEIPNLIGQSARAATINLRRRSLDLGATAETEIPGTTDERVVAQSPLANASEVSSPKISLLIARPVQAERWLMPSFIGQPLGSVTLALNNAGFRVGTVKVTDPSAAPASPASVVVSQNPAAGEKVSEGDTIDFQVR